MSILPCLYLAKVEVVVPVAPVVLLLLSAASIFIAVVAKVLPPRNVSGPDRIPPDRSSWPLVGVLFATLGVYLFTMSLYTTLKYPAAAQSAAAGTPQQLSPGDDAFMATVPPLLTLLALLGGDWFIRPALGQDLGVESRRFRSGLVKGLLGVVIVIPLLFLLSNLLDIVYRMVQYQHPNEHPLLHAMGERPGPLVMAAIAIGACVIAPVFEEVLFRAHIQTLLRRAFYRMTRPKLPARTHVGFPVIMQGPAETGDTPFAQVTAPSGPTAAHTWAAILVTSAIFASLHPTWSAPIIFVLAVCLGYAYERTGNLWVSITIHAAFNSISTALFLIGLYAH